MDMEPMQQQRPIMVMLHQLLLNLREASTGGEFLSALTLIGLAIAQFTTTPATTSLLILIFGAKFSTFVIVAFMVLAATHLVCFMLPSSMPMIAVRKILSVGGMLIWGSLVVDLARRGQVGGVVVFSGLTLLLFIAIWRGRY